MSSPVVSLVKFEDTYESLKKAIELCDGLSEIKKEDKILIKPNLVSWDFELPFPPYGVVTTAVVISALVRILKEEGYSNITVGESPLNAFGNMGRDIFKEMGLDKLEQNYGISLVDFNEENFTKINCGGMELSLADRVLEADKIINVPVLKTHNQTKISLGIKNLKGCMNKKSKMHCHSAESDLDHTFPHIIEKLPVALTIIDGIYALEKGPGINGKAERRDMLLASKNALAVDMAGAYLLGYPPGEIEHLNYYAIYNNHSLDINDIETKGEDLYKNSYFTDYDWEWIEDNTMPKGFAKRGITGLAVRKYDNTMCTGCSFLFNPVLVMLMGAFKDEPFPNMEIVSGKKQKAAPGFDKTVLFGQCACKLNKNNPDIKKAIPIKGCPPDLKDFVSAMQEEGVQCDYNDYIKYRYYLHNRYKTEDGFNMEHFKI